MSMDYSTLYALKFAGECVLVMLTVYAAMFTVMYAAMLHDNGMSWKETFKKMVGIK